MTITPKPEYGEPSDWNNLESLKTAVSSGDIHPLDLKFGVADALAESLSPLMEHFEKNSELLEQVNAITN